MSENYNGKAIMEGLQALGENAVAAVDKGVRGLGALLAAIPGLGAVGEAVVASASRGENPMREDMQITHSSPPIARSAAPERVVEKVVEVPSAPRIPEQALAAVNAMRNDASLNYSPADSPNVTDLSYLSPSATPSTGVPSKGTGMNV